LYVQELVASNAQRQRPTGAEQFLWYKERSDTTKIAQRREVHDCESNRYWSWLL